MSSFQLLPTLHLCIRPSTPSISHPSILSPAGSPAYYFLDTAPVHLPLKLAQFCLRALLVSTLVLRIFFVGFLAAQSDALARVHPQLRRSSSPSPITSHLARAASLKLNTTLGAYITDYSQRRTRR
ncbi:hypothetical protein B0H13DRAFT_2308043 [Mycena leptocephala]|nr:hypothetical protein B0H13DRAFT_2308043 [Mycena leptocephala]